jgi:carboxymethylenebutenolidase
MVKRLIALLLAASVIGFAKEKESCCSPSATAEFAALAGNESFIAAHLSPLPFTYTPKTGTMVTFKCSDGTDGSAFFVKSPKKTDRVILMFHEWWGLNDYIKREAESLQKDLGNVNIYALDLFDGKVATDPKEAAALTSGMKEERARAIIQGAIDYVGPKARIATIGWCFGGGWSLQATLMAGKQAAGCVMYYGMPEQNIDRLKTLHADVIGFFGTQDAYITPALVKQFQHDMKEAGKHLEATSYDAPHAFANPSNPKYNKEAAADAHKRAIAFLKKHLMKK